VVRTPEAFREKQGIEVVLHHRATRIDRGSKRVELVSLPGGEKKVVSYDRLVVATGARSRRTGLAGEEAKNFFTLKDLHDAIRIKQFVDRNTPRRAAILGAGYIGLEMAEAFVQRGMETVLLARGERPVSHLEPEISQMVLDELRSQGVRFEAGWVPTSFHCDQTGRIYGLETSKGHEDADLVLCALGVVPNAGILQQAGIPPGETGAIRADSRQATDDPDVFAAGDCCEVFHRVLDRWVHMPMGDVANKQGRVAGENAAGGDAVFHGIVGSQCFKLFSLQVASTGITEQAARNQGLKTETQTIRGNSAVHYMPGAAPVFLKLVFEKNTGRILGAHMAGREGVARRINTLAVAVQAGLSVETVARMDFAYAPHFSPPFDPILLAAEQAIKRL
jgi:NADPH-dependent 2,4-dienoyl-CoA reductase/sulfur reductase-like enzyme